MAEPTMATTHKPNGQASLVGTTSGQESLADSAAVTLAEIATYPTCPSATEAAYAAGPSDDVTKALQNGMLAAKHAGFHFVGALADSPTAVSGDWLNLILGLVGSDFQFATETPISRLMTCDPADLAAAQASQHHGEKIWPIVLMALGVPPSATTKEAFIPRHRAISPVRPAAPRPLPQREPVRASEAQALPTATVQNLEWAAREAETIAHERTLRRLAEKVAQAPTQFKTKFLHAIDQANHNVVRQRSRTIANSTEKVDFLWEYTEDGMRLTLWGLRGVVTDTFSYRMNGNTSENVLFRRYLALREIPARELLPPHGAPPIAHAGAQPPAPVMVWLRDYIERFASWLKREESGPRPSGAPTTPVWSPQLSGWEGILANQAELFQRGRLSLDGLEAAVSAANNLLQKWVDIPITKSFGRVETARLSWKYSVREGEVIIEATLTGPKKGQEVGMTFKQFYLTKLEDRAKQLEKLYLDIVDLW